MCNLYKLNASAVEVAAHFVASFSANLNAGGDTYPGQSGIVVAGGEVQSMVWGFPLNRVSEKTGKLLKPKPVNNCRTDKLDSRFWNASFRERRCVIPVSSYAEAEGQKGKMTKTWFSDPDVPVMAIAGVWLVSSEWGAVFSMIMTEASPAVSEIHNRMPVILKPDDWGQFVRGDEEEAKSLCVPYTGKLAIDRTDDLWFKRG
ncbi:SOS response-associated peptidase family protein [Sphingomonadaceae bacterium]|nr:SOS response-associated peptidase family protein [Sphingomonadaceae bacterium]